MGRDLKGAESFCPDETSIPTRHIPAPVWGHALDYVPYNEVRSALLICKTIANEAARHVQTVCFTKACQLDAPALGRFPNITEVKCLCLIHGDFFSTTLCEDTVFRIVPLLTALPRLERFFIGGMWNGRVLKYIPEAADSSFNRNLALMKALFRSFLGALKGRMFSSTLERTNLCRLLYFLFRRHDNLGVCTDRDNGNLCKVCKDICSYFPLQDAISRCSIKVGCMEEREAVVFSLEIIGKREGAKNIFQRKRSCKLLLLPVLRQNLRPFNYDKHPKEGHLLRRNLSKVVCSRNGFSDVPMVYFLPYATLAYLDRSISLGISPRAIPRWKNVDVGSRVIIKSTFDALVCRGFALDEDDFIVLDETVEPALQCALGQMYSCINI